MILITGASGKTGQALLNMLAHFNKPVRALIRHPDDAPKMIASGAVEVALGDLTDFDSLLQAMRGTLAVYLICPNMSPNEVEMGRLAIQAAQRCGVQHFVYHSVLHPQVQAMPHHWNKMRVEELLFTSGLDYTILQPTAYMQNVLAYWSQITGEGVYPLPYAPESRLSLVDLVNVAEVAARVLGEPQHFGATYELVGTGPLTQHEVAAIIAGVLKRPVQAKAIDRAVWVERARQSGMPEYSANTLCMMFEYYERYGLWGNPRVLSGLLGRAPVGFEDFIRRSLHIDS